MSDVDDGEDLEFLKAFEDELYNDQLSVGRYIMISYMNIIILLLVLMHVTELNPC